MCGFNAIWKYNQPDVDDVLQAMNASIAHRGPDASGVWKNEFIALGHRRLSILDTSENGNQPFFSDDRDLVIVFNGEVYNFLEIKKELASKHSFRSGTDTEVILAAYREWGIECVQRFIGMFAFALWDNTKNKAYVVRDRLGIKPVYFAKTDKGTLFSSEIRAILSSGWVRKRVSNTGLQDYLRYQTVHAPATIVEGILMLMPGHYMELDGNTEKVTCYWKSQDFATVTDPTKPRNEYLKEIRSTLRSSVELRMRADVPFGAFLSGGIDSSIVVGLMAEVATKPVKTFAITFHEKEWDESPYSDSIAALFRTDHQSIRVSARHFLELVPEALEAMDHPSGDGPNTYVVSGATRQAGVKMAMSGLGGDELFAGYDVFKRMMRIEQQAWINAAPKALRGWAGAALMQLKPSVASEKIKTMLQQPAVDLANAYPLSRQIFSDAKVAQWMASAQVAPNSVAIMAQLMARLQAPTLSKVSILEMESYMQNVLLRDTDQMSMAHALEVRVPFLDHRLVELVLGIPDNIKYPHTPKQLLTDAVGNLIPREIIDRPKMGFSFPWGKWMKEDLKALCEENLRILDGFGFFKQGEMERLWLAFLNGDPLVSWSRVWPLVVLGHWLAKNGFDKQS